MPKHKIGVIVIHGVGSEGNVRPPSSDELTFSAAMSRRVRRKLGEASQQVAWREVCWSDILSSRKQAYLADIAEKTSSNAARGFVMGAMSDAAAYRKTSDGSATIYQQIHARVEAAVRDIEADVGANAQLLILAHSLGGQIVSNYIYDLQQFEKRTGEARFYTSLQNMRTVGGLMTFGCNIPVFLFGHKPENLTAIEYPGVDLPEEQQITAWWQNFYDRNDILAYPLGPAAPCYAKMVSDRNLRDIPIHLGTPVTEGWDPLSHGSYWDDAELIAPVVHYINKMLA